MRPAFRQPREGGTVTEEQRLLITRIERGETDDGKPVVELFEDNPRLKWPSLRLFDLSKLFTVGVDPNELQQGEERFVRFYACYVESDRVNGQGNPYKDVTRLEGMESDQDGQALQDRLDQIVELLVNIEHHLARMATPVYSADTSDNVQMPDPPSAPRGQPAHRQGDPKPQPAEKVAPDPEPVLDEDMARKRFSELAGPAIRNGTIPFTVPGKLTKQISAKALNWRDALAELEKEIAAGEH
jgi:hypothetical protein